MSPVSRRSDNEAGMLVDEALAILRYDLRPAVELAERDDERARRLHALVAQVRDAVAVWREVDAVTGAAVVNPVGGER